MGAYHTIDLELNRKFTLIKEYWDVIALERVGKCGTHVQDFKYLKFRLNFDKHHRLLLSLLKYKVSDFNTTGFSVCVLVISCVKLQG